MSWECRYTDKESNIDFTLSHTYLWGRGAIRSAGFVISDELLNAIENRDPEIFEILEAATKNHELVFFIKDLQSGDFLEETIDMVGGESNLRTKLEAALACDSPLISPRNRELAQHYLSRLDTRIRDLEQAEAEKSYTEKRRKRFNKVRAGLMLKVIERDGYQCTKCGGTDDLSLDHIHPLSKGGSDDLENLQILCRKHNSQKNNRIPTEAEPVI